VKMSESHSWQFLSSRPGNRCSSAKRLQESHTPINTDSAVRIRPPLMTQFALTFPVSRVGIPPPMARLDYRGDLVVLPMMHVGDCLAHSGGPAIHPDTVWRCPSGQSTPLAQAPAASLWPSQALPLTARSCAPDALGTWRLAPRSAPWRRRSPAGLRTSVG
jgi:hypothetical protein